jgi:hypothetical protein
LEKLKENDFDSTIATKRETKGPAEWVVPSSQMLVRYLVFADPIRSRRKTFAGTFSLYISAMPFDAYRCFCADL